MARQQKSVQVGVVMGSESDWDVMQHAVAQLAAFGVTCEAKVVSAHRTPDAMFAYASGAAARGLACIIAGAGGAAHLPGMLAAKTTLPVLGVPIPTRHLNGEDSLLSIVQMPKGVPVATFESRWPINSTAPKTPRWPKSSLISAPRKPPPQLR